jgi:phosphoglycolate phosphatase
MNAATGRPLDIVLFDLDGTLVETGPEIRDAVNDTLDALALPRAPLERVEAWIGHGTERLLQVALAHATGRPPAAVSGSRLWHAAQPHFSAATSAAAAPPAGSTRTRAKCCKRWPSAAGRSQQEQPSCPCCATTVCASCLILRVVRRTRCQTAQPRPAGVHDCLRAFGVDAARAVFVGDSRSTWRPLAMQASRSGP